ncbi:MAG TPA: acyl carrier protein [Steroidobacteraceae bacterium]
MNTQDIFELVVRHTREVVPELQAHSFQGGDRLDDLGANSVDRAEIIQLVLESLALQIPRIEMFGPSSIGELVELIHGKLRAG